MRYRSGFFYLVVIGAFSTLIYIVLQTGKGLEAGRQITLPTTDLSYWSQFLDSLLHNIGHPLAILLAQIVTIIFAARVLGWVCKKIGQPTVIGEIAAGILLGPSLIGMYLPEVSAALFPPQSLGNLQFLSQIGLILFMFVIGMELDLKSLQSKAHEAVVISHASIIIPFSLGLGLAYWMYQSYAPDGVQFLSFGLFMGIAMSITAFPVLARIVQERGLHKTKLGTVVLTCAAADDITAWCILAAVIAIVKAGSFVSALYIIALSIIYMAVMMWGVRPFLRRVGDLYSTSEGLSKPIVAIFFLTLLLSAFASEVIGIHALFGAFMAGAIMPDNAKFRSIFIEKVEDVSLVLLLPLFFVFTGLRTQIGLLDDIALWQVCGLIVLVAVVGKFAGSALAARFVGQNWKDSLTIGALMNTRGLMELVVLNIGYDLGVLSPQIFAMMVIMALVTTVMTGPALDIINRIFRERPVTPVETLPVLRHFRVLISFANPKSGKTLLRLAHTLVKQEADATALTVMHLTPSAELHHFNIDEYEQESFASVHTESLALSQPFSPLFKASNDIDADIVQETNEGQYDLLLIGLGKSIFEGSLLGKVLGFTTRIMNPDRLINKVTGKEKLFENAVFEERTHLILSNSERPVGILIDKDLEQIQRILVTLFDPKDTYLLTYAQKMVQNVGMHVTVLDASGKLKNNKELKEFRQAHPEHVDIITEKKPTALLLAQSDLLLIGLYAWKQQVEAESTWLNATPSTLIVKP